MKTLMPYRGFTFVDRMRDELDDAFQRVFGPATESAENGGPFAWSPRVDVEETDRAITVKADLPGVDPKDVEVTIRDGTLFLRGERKEEREEKGKNFHRVERFAGSFYRAVPLPTGADEAGVTATTAKGVVTVTVPKRPESQPKKIPVQSKDA